MTPSARVRAMQYGQHAITVVLIGTVHGMQQIAGVESSKAIAGTGHTLLTAGMSLRFLGLRNRLKAEAAIVPKG